VNEWKRRIKLCRGLMGTAISRVGDHMGVFCKDCNITWLCSTQPPRQQYVPILFCVLCSFLPSFTHNTNSPNQINTSSPSCVLSYHLSLTTHNKINQNTLSICCLVLRFLIELGQLCLSISVYNRRLSLYINQHTFAWNFSLRTLEKKTDLF